MAPFVLADAINRAKSTQSEAVVKALLATNISGDQVIYPWKGIKFDPKSHQNIYATGTLVQIQEEQYNTVWPFESAAKDVVWPFPGWKKIEEVREDKFRGSGRRVYPVDLPSRPHADLKRMSNSNGRTTCAATGQRAVDRLHVLPDCHRVDADLGGDEYRQLRSRRFPDARHVHLLLALHPVWSRPALFDPHLHGPSLRPRDADLPVHREQGDEGADAGPAGGDLRREHLPVESGGLLMDPRFSPH